VEREIFMKRNGVIVWRGLVDGTTKNDVSSAQEYFKEAWRRAIQDGAVTAADAGEIQFCISGP